MNNQNHRHIIGVAQMMAETLEMYDKSEHTNELGKAYAYDTIRQAFVKLQTELAEFIKEQNKQNKKGA